MSSRGIAPIDGLDHDDARYLAPEQDIGTFDPGRLAHLVALDTDPLEDLHEATAIDFVPKNGEVVE